jgi:hypothetical protein
MAEEVNDVIQKGNVLLGIAQKYASPPAEIGIAADLVAELKTEIETCKQNNSLQQSAVRTVDSLTNIQNIALEKAFTLIRKVQNGAKAEFGEDDKVRMREFHVGNRVPYTVKGIKAELEYLKTPVQAHLAELAKHGITDATVTLLGTCSDDLTKADVDQEDGKKLQKNATKARDASADALKKLMRKVRSSAKSVFEDKPEILTEFEPIPAGRGAKAEEPAPPPAPEQPAQ